MHTAHNIAYENIDTELNMCIDSDDCVAVGAVKKILNGKKLRMKITQESLDWILICRERL